MKSEEYEKIEKQLDRLSWEMLCDISRIESLVHDYESIRDSLDCNARAITTLAKAGVIPDALLVVKAESIGGIYRVLRYENDKLILQDANGKEFTQHYMGMLKALEDGKIEVMK